MSPRASANPAELIKRLRNRKSLSNALKVECVDEKGCFLCLENIPKSSYVIFGERIVKKQGKKKCDCTIVHARSENDEITIRLILLEIKPNLFHSLNEAKKQLKDTYDETSRIFKGLITSMRSEFADALVERLFVIMCPPVKADEFKSSESELSLRIDGSSYQIIHLECGQHLVKDLVDCC